MKQRGSVMLISLILMLLLSLYALVSLQHSNLMHQQLASFNRGQALVLMADSAMQEAVTSIQRMGNESLSLGQWISADVSAFMLAGASAKYRIEYLGEFATDAGTAKRIRTRHQSVYWASHHYRVQIELALKSAYTRKFQVYYVKAAH